MRIVLLSLLASVSGCFCVDTCPRANNFEQVSLVSEPAADAGVLSLSFTRSAVNLPDPYFAAASPGALNGLEQPDAGWVVPTSVGFSTPDRLDVALPRPVGDVVKFRLGFPDRRKFIQCSHPGSDDFFLLEVGFDRAASPTFKWSQSVDIGPI
ncbi:MAG: hypothetical protein GQE15_04345 [Archangiaceae bacterium]|nr:hypothetical protein [Archangiaceae bacterium]